MFLKFMQKLLPQEVIFHSNRSTRQVIFKRFCLLLFCFLFFKYVIFWTKRLLLFQWMALIQPFCPLKEKEKQEIKKIETQQDIINLKVAGLMKMFCQLFFSHYSFLFLGKYFSWPTYLQTGLIMRNYNVGWSN